MRFKLNQSGVVQRVLTAYLGHLGLTMSVSGQGLFKQTTFKKQSGLGSTATGAGGQIMRRKTATFNKTTDTTENDEITSHRMSTGVTYGGQKTVGKAEGNLSPGTYSPFLAAICRADFAAAPSLVAGTDVTTSATAPQITDASAGLLAAGFKTFMVVRFTGFTTTAAGNNSRNFWITALTASTMSGVFLDGGAAMAVKAPETGSVTITAVGKFTKAPETGHTNDYFTFEEWYPDLSKSEVYPDVKPAQAQIAIPAQGPATISIDLPGLGSRTLGTSQSFTSPAAETTTDVCQAINGAIYANGSAVSYVTSLTLTADIGATPVGPAIGTAVSEDFNQARLKVSGSFTARFSSTALQTLYDAQTAITLAVVSCTSSSATADFVAFAMTKVKITSDAPDDGEKIVSRTYAFTAEINGSGGSALANDKGILMIQDSAAV